MPVVLYMNYPSSPCRAVLMCCKALKIEYEIKLMNLPKREQLEEWFVKMNPNHTIPTIDDEGFYLWESRAIMRYLASKYAPDSALYPKDLHQRAVVDRMLDFDMALGQSVSAYLNPRIFDIKCPSKDDPKIEEKLKNRLKKLDESIPEGSYAAGASLSLADISLMETINQLSLAEYDIATYANIVRWQHQATQALPDYEECHKQFYEFKEFVKTEQFRIIIDEMFAKKD